VCCKIAISMCVDIVCMCYFSKSKKLATQSTQDQDKQNKKYNTICVGHHYAQANTNNVNKTWALLQTTGGKYCLIYVICLCLVRLYLQLFVRGFMSYLCYLSLFSSSLPPVVCKRVHASYKQLEVMTNQAKTNNINKTWTLLQTTGGTDEPNKHK
jgi:hypothetical protein